MSARGPQRQGVYWCAHCEAHVAPEDVAHVEVPPPNPPLDACPTCRRALRFEAHRTVRPFRYPLGRESAVRWILHLTYFGMVGARMLGLLVSEHQDEL